MGLRTLLGLPPKPSKKKASSEDKGKSRDYSAISQKADQVAGLAQFDLLTEAQQKTFHMAREEADGLAAHEEYKAATDRLTAATAVVANQMNGAQTAKTAVEQISPKVSGVLDGAQLLGVPKDHMSALRERYNKLIKESDQDWPAAADGLKALALDISNDMTIKAAKAARDRVLSEKDKVEAAATEALKVEAETPEVLKQNRILADALPKIGFNSGKLNYLEAEKYIDICNACIVKINAEAPGIAAAIQMRDEVTAKRKSIDGDVNLARKTYGLTKDAKSLVEQFKDTDQAFEGAMADKEYKDAKTLLKTLESLAKRVVELRPAMEEDERKKAKKKDLLSDVRAEENAFGAVPKATPELKRIWGLALAELNAFFDAYNANELDTADACLVTIKQLHTEFDEAAEDAADELAKEQEAIDYWSDNCADRFEDLKNILGSLPEMSSAIATAKKTFDDLNKNLSDCDFSTALALAKKLKVDLDAVDDLKDKNDEAIQRRNEGYEEYAKNQALWDEAMDVKPNTPEMALLFKTFTANHDEFHRLRREGDPIAIDMLPQLIDDAQAVIDGKEDNDAGELEGELAAEEARDKAIPEYNKARDIAKKYEPRSTLELRALTRLAESFNWAFKAGRFMESIEYLKGIPDAAKAIYDKENEWKAAAAQDKDAYDKRYKKVIKDFDKVVLYEWVLPGLQQDIEAVEDLKSDADSAYGKKEIGKASGILDDLEEGVADLVARKSEHDAAVADRQWVEDKARDKGDELDAAVAGFALLPETQDIQARLKYASNVVKTASDELDFAEARSQWVEIERLLILWSGKEADNDNAWTPEAEEVHDRYSALEADLDIANEVRGITPDLKKAVNDFQKVDGQFWKAYRGLDWQRALDLMDEYERLAKLVAAAKPDFDKAMLEAQPRADKAKQDLTAVSPEDLKSKSTDDKLQLLEDLRATGAKLDKDQLKLQRKLYASLDYDPEFKEADEGRRSKLVEDLKSDEEITKARGKWAEMTDEDRMKVLTKVMTAECKVFGIPAPKIRLFYEPPGDYGFFDPSAKTLNLNTHVDAGWLDYKEIVNTVVHENMHNYQFTLVERLKEGIITKDDPEYTQALIFAANFDGYVPPSEELDDDEKDTNPYKTQPVEAHAWDSGDGVSADLVAEEEPPKGVTL